MKNFNFSKDWLTDEEKNWFGDRMHESSTGRVIVPSYLITKFRKLVGDENLDKLHIKTWLITNCY